MADAHHMGVSSYVTVARRAEAELEVKRSRFLATVARVDNEAAARIEIERLRKTHWDARHHCTAIVVGPDGELQRSSDDGEPSGTAGAPMLEVIRGAGVSDVVVVVTRWFGGVLLGSGGLVRAYSDAVRAGLEAAGRQERQLLNRWAITTELADAGRLEADLRGRGVSVSAMGYTANDAIITVAVRSKEADSLVALVAALSAGFAQTTVLGEEWVDS